MPNSILIEKGQYCFRASRGEASFPILCSKEDVLKDFTAPAGLWEWKLVREYVELCILPLFQMFYLVTYKTTAFLPLFLNGG